MLMLQRATYIKEEETGEEIPCLIFIDRAENEYLIRTTECAIDAVNDILEQIDYIENI